MWRKVYYISITRYDSNKCFICTLLYGCVIREIMSTFMYSGVLLTSHHKYYRLNKEKIVKDFSYRIKLFSNNFLRNTFCFSNNFLSFEIICCTSFITYF